LVVLVETSFGYFTLSPVPSGAFCLCGGFGVGQ